MATEIVISCNGGEPIEREAIIDPSVPAAPASITRRQAKLALLAAGLLNQAEDALADEGPAAQIEWADALTFDRGNPLIAAIGGAIGLDEAGIDDLFRAAAAL